MSITERKHGGVYSILSVSGKYSEFVKPKNPFDLQGGHIQKCVSHYIEKKGLKLVFESKQMRSAASKEEIQGFAAQIVLLGCNV